MNDFINEIENFLFEGEQGDKILRDPKYLPYKASIRKLKKQIVRFDFWAQIIMGWDNLSSEDFKKFIPEIIWYEKNRELISSLIHGRERNLLSMSLDDFYNFITKAKEKLEGFHSSRAKGFKETEDAIIYYEDKNFILVRPKTYKGSCKYGSSTRWCISGKYESDSHWKIYTKNAFYLFLINKNLQSGGDSDRTIGFKIDNNERSLDYALNADDQRINTTNTSKEYLLSSHAYFLSNLREIFSSQRAKHVGLFSLKSLDFLIKIISNNKINSEKSILNLKNAIQEHFPNIKDDIFKIFESIDFIKRNEHDRKKEFIDNVKDVYKIDLNNEEIKISIFKLKANIEFFLKKYKIQLNYDFLMEADLPENVENYSLPGFCKNAAWKNANARILYLILKNLKVIEAGGVDWKNGEWLSGTFFDGIWNDGYWHKGIWKKNLNTTWQKGFIKNKQGHWVLSKKDPAEYYKTQNIKMEEAIILKEILSQIKKDVK